MASYRLHSFILAVAITPGILASPYRMNIRAAKPQSMNPSLMGSSAINPQLLNSGMSGSQIPQDGSLATSGGCTFSGTSCARDLASSKNGCSNIIISNCQVPGGTTLDLSSLEDNTQVTFKGTTTFEAAAWDGPLVIISGDGLTITGDPDSVLDGNGAQYWDNMGERGSKKPKFFFIRAMRSSTIDGINLLNTPVQAFSISNVQDLTMTNCQVDNRAGDGAGARNTDGFNVGNSAKVTIQGATVYNQDDCIAVNSGTDITFSGGMCANGNGISFGSVGGRDTNDLDTVIFESTQVVNSDNGVRIKTNKGTTGSVVGCTFKDITLQNIRDFGIIIDQSYPNIGGTPTNGVSITGLTVQNVQGTVDSDGYNIFINCGDGSCSDWNWSGNQIQGGQTSDACRNVPPEASC